MNHRPYHTLNFLQNIKQTNNEETEKTHHELPVTLERLQEHMVLSLWPHRPPHHAFSFSKGKGRQKMTVVMGRKYFLRGKSNRGHRPN